MDSYDTLDSLIAVHPTGVQGDAYLVGGDLYVWDTVSGTWDDVGTIQGPTGPTGALSPIQQIFNVTNQTSSRSVYFEGDLAINSDTLDITIEQGPAVKIEKRDSIGTIIPFSSQVALTINTGTGTFSRANIAMIGFGSGDIIASSHDPIVFPIALGNCQLDFIIPANGTITAFSASITATAGGALGNSSFIKAQIFKSDEIENSFYAIDETTINFLPIEGLILTPEFRRDALSDLEIPVTAGTRLFIGYHFETPTVSTSSLITGFMSGSIEIK